MEQLSVGRAVELHRRLWNWIADRTEQDQRYLSKADALRELGFEPLDIRAQCFCCEYVKQNQLLANTKPCVLCPLKWSFGTCSNWDGTGEYDQYLQAVHDMDWERAVWLARHIATLPAKYEED